MTAPTGPVEDTFVEVMGGVCTPVAVVTAFDGDRPHGTTVSAFASLSRQPPMVMVALDERSDLLHIVRRTRLVGINVLASVHAGLATRFAGKGAEKFSGVDWERCHGLPRLAGTSGWLACDVVDLVLGGDHTIVLGRVVGAGSRPAEPLVYHRRSFGTHRALDAGGVTAD
ncbi:flavin reductase family protein [Pseudonocardia nematodicida]|uniref:Flavin reductase family protein n=1 Tax=Pseudonocardia nematodicida TaxID=1206997 RepID=A0ABV1K5N9_9PSEU